MNIKVLFLAGCIVLVTATSSGQTVFQGAYGGTMDEGIFSGSQTADNGYILAGYSKSFGSGQEDFYLLKIDDTGNPTWARTYGGVGSDWAYDVKQTSDDGYIMVGYTSNFGVAGVFDVYLVKTDASGTVLWSKIIGGTEADQGSSVVETSDGGYGILAATASFGPAGFNLYLLKTDRSGNLLWSKVIGGLNSEWGNQLQQTTDGGFILIGRTASYGAGSSDVYLIKTDGSGNVSWTRTFGGSAADEGVSVQQTTDGGYIVTGLTNSFGAGNSDVYLVKTDGSGNLSWSRAFGGSGNERGYAVKQAIDGGYIISGFTFSFGAGGQDIYVLKTDGGGNLLWSKTYGGSASDWSNSVSVTSDGGYAVFGSTQSFGSGGYDKYLIKIDGLGESGCSQLSPFTLVASPPTVVNTGSTTTNGGIQNTPTTVETAVAARLTAICNIIPLPVTLLSFTVRAVGNGHHLCWETASEKNNSHYLVERSTDGITFFSIGKVSGMGNAATKHVYSHIDEYPATGINYYRLTSVDFDGTERNLSSIVSANNVSSALFVGILQPNPAEASTKIPVYMIEAGNITIEITGILGNTFTRYIQELQPGINTLIVNTEFLPKGAYLVKISTGKGIDNCQKLIK